MQIVEAFRPDLLLTNVYLNGISGRDAIAQIKRHCPDLRVLMVSGLPDETIILESANAGGFDIFPKPFKATDLTSKVSQLLQD